MTEFYVVERGECDACGGTGKVGFEYYCEECEYELDASIMQSPMSIRLPCGHAGVYAVEKTVFCNECDGTGKIERHVSLKEALTKIGFSV